MSDSETAWEPSWNILVKFCHLFKPSDKCFRLTKEMPMFLGHATDVSLAHKLFLRAFKGDRLYICLLCPTLLSSLIATFSNWQIIFLQPFELTGRRRGLRKTGWPNYPSDQTSKTLESSKKVYKYKTFSLLIWRNVIMSSRNIFNEIA